MKKIKAHIESDEVYTNRVIREDVFKMMTQEEHDEYTRELEDKVENYKSIVMGIKSSCETTLRCNERIMKEHFKDYDGRYYDKEREDHTIFETENTQAEIMLDTINKQLKEKKI